MALDNGYEKALDSDGNIWIQKVTAIPSGTAGYAIGCILIHKTDGKIYNNTGTATSCAFNEIGAIVAGEITLAEGNLLLGAASGLAAAIDASTDGNIIIGNGTTAVSVAVSGDITITNAGVATIANDSVTSAKVDEGLIQDAVVTVSSAEILALNTTPKELIAAPGAGKAIIVDKISTSVNYNTTAYTTNTTLEFRYTNGSGTKLSADDTATLLVTADSSVSVGGIEAQLVNPLNAPVVVNAATGNPAAGDSDIKVHIAYRIISI